MTTVLALDLATVTGFARGAIDAPAPTSGSIKFRGPGGASEQAIFGNCLDWITAELARAPVDMLVLEAMLPAGAMRGQTQRKTRDLLAGLRGIVIARANRARVFDIREASVLDVRGHFIGDRGLARDAAKREVMRQCRRLGWPVADDNAADACALWSFACGMIDPQTAIKVSPLFGLRGVTA